MEDESNYLINYGMTEEKTIMSIPNQKVYPTGWPTYPMFWASWAINITANETQIIVSRETYSLFDLFGDVGGAAELIWFVMRTSISMFANQKLTSLAGNRMYTDGKANTQLIIPRCLLWQTVFSFLPSFGVQKCKNNKS